MGKHVTETLAANLNRLIGPGRMFSSNEAAAEKSKVGRSTIDRARKAEVSIRVDNLDELATAFRLEAWQLLVKELDPASPPQLAKPDRPATASVNEHGMPFSPKLLKKVLALTDDQRGELEVEMHHRIEMMLERERRLKELQADQAKNQSA